MNTQGKWFVSGLLFSAAITLAAPGDPDPAINPLLDRSNVKVVAQSGSRLAISGSFTTVNNIPRAGVARLNADGSVDPTFAPAPSPDGVAGIYPLSNDKLLLAGSFTNVSSISRVALARLNSDGPVDPAFEVNWLAGGLRPGGPPPIPGAPLFGCSIHAVLRDGSLIALANNLWLPNGSEVPRLVKISTTGQIDATFTMPFNVPFVQTTAIWPLANGKLLALYGGYNDSGRLVRCNANGSLDSSFPEISTPRFLYQVVEQSDGKILLFGDFANQSVSRIHPDGALDTSFHPAVSGEVRAGAVQADGKIGIVGAFQLHGSTNTYTVARLNADGSLDVGFHALTGGLYEVSGVTIDSDGRIVSFGGGRVNNRRYEDGVRRHFKDDAQSPGVFVLSETGIEVDEGKNASVEIVGASGQTGAAFVDLELTAASATGESDFNPATIHLQFAAGEARKTVEIPIVDDSQIEPIESFRIALKNPSAAAEIGWRSNGEVKILDNDGPGSIVGSFRLRGSPGYSSVNTMSALADGSVFVGGNFSHVQGYVRPGLAKLKADGALDLAF